MATTTNYAWETPDDTDLVKDGAAAIRTLGSSVDTTTKALNPSTTLGDIEYRSATANTNTRLPIGTDGQVLTVTGGVPAWGAVDPLLILDAKGDLITATAADTPARLPVGTNGQALLANSATATGLEWGLPASGGMTSLASGSLSGASLSLSSIPSGYVDLVLYIRGAQGSSANQISFTINGVSGGSNYGGGTLAGSYTERINAGFIAASAGNSIQNDTFMSIRFFDYLNAHMGIVNTVNSSSAATTNRSFNFFSDLNQNAVTSITVNVSGANWTQGTYVLYGVK